MLKKLISLMIATSMTLSLITVPTYSVSAADTTIKLGDYVQMGIYEDKPMLWRCVAFEKISGYDEGGNPIIDSTNTVTEYQNGYLPLMLADDSICIKSYDASGDAATGSHSRGNRIGKCSNYWGDSNIRDWLNSDDETVTYTCGNKPRYADEAGFLTNFYDSEKVSIKSVTQKSLLSEVDKDINGATGSEAHKYKTDIYSVYNSVQNYSTAYSEQITDKIFLLDVQQVYNVSNNDKYFGWKKYYRISESYALRTPTTGGDWGVRILGWDLFSGIANASADSAYGIRPAFFLDVSSPDFISGAGTKEEPYELYKTNSVSTESNPIKISTAEEFAALANEVNSGDNKLYSYYELTSDIDISAVCGADLNGEMVSWTPIGNLDKAFAGGFNGNGYSVTGLYINSNDAYQGLFGYLAPNSTIKNLNVIGTVSGCDTVGGICGYNNGAIINCSFRGSLSGSSNGVGGICGTNVGSVADSHNEGKINGTGGFIGGICGDNSGDIERCYNEGGVTNTGLESAAGICGINSGNIINCYNTGRVQSKNKDNNIYGKNLSGGNMQYSYSTSGSITDEMSSAIKSGKLAWEFQSEQENQVWGQDLSSDEYPKLTNDASKIVYKVTLKNGNDIYNELFVNYGSKIQIKSTKYMFGGWYKDESLTQQWSDKNDIVTEDTTLYCKWNYDGEGNDTVAYPLDHGVLIFDKKTGSIVNAGGSFYSTTHIPSEIDGVAVTDIGDYAFTNCYIRGIDLPNTITRIGEGAFKKSKIKYINIPSSVRVIEKEAFYDCPLEGITFNPGLKTIGDSAFYSTAVDNLELPNTVESIGDSAFRYSTMRYALIYGSIGDYAFGNVRCLYSVKIHRCSSIGDGAFQYSSLRRATVYEYEKEEDKDYHTTYGVHAFDSRHRHELIEVTKDFTYTSYADRSSRSRNVGNLQIIGGISDEDYTYSESTNTLTILSSNDMLIKNYDGDDTLYSDELLEDKLILNSVDETVSGQALVALAANDEVASGQAVTAFADEDYSESEITNTQIVIAKDVDAVLTLDGVNIDGEGEIENALSLESGSSLDLTLMGDNTLIGGNSSVGIDVANGAELTVDGDGSLTLSGGSGAADIGGSAVINGGTITANGDIFGFEENVTFNGGIITFSDEYVNLGSDFDGVVYVGEVGEVHGDVVISQSITLPEDTNLYIPADKATLTITDDAVITIPPTSNLTITYGGREITITPIGDEDCVMGTYSENGLYLSNGTIVIEGTDELWLTCITMSEGGIIIFNEDGSIEVPAETYVEINLDDGITVGQYGGIIRPDGTVTDNVSVLLNSQGGSFIFIPPVPTGDKITKPENPILGDYTFGGWYKEAECLTAWDFENETANESMTLYAKWTKPTDDNTGDNPNDNNPDKDNPDDKSDDSSLSGKVSRGGGGGRASSAAVKKENAEAEETETNTPNETDETKEPVTTTKQFTDVKDGMWYTEAVNYAVENGLFFGTSDTLFSPNAQMTRGMIATVLYRAEGEPKTEKSAFTDVVSGEWYANAVNWAAENNIVSGYGNGLFKPNDNITREQLASILYRYAGSPATSSTALTFADTDKVSSYAKNALLWATENGIIYGKDNNMLDPQGEATRAEVAAMLMRYFSNIQGGEQQAKNLL